MEFLKGMIICKSSGEIEKLRRSGRMVRQILDEIRDRVRPGVSTLDLENFVRGRLKEAGAKPAFKGYRGYPCCLCASVNDQVIHGIPSGRRVEGRRYLGLDLGRGAGSATTATPPLPCRWEPNQRIALSGC